MGMKEHFLLLYSSHNSLKSLMKIKYISYPKRPIRRGSYLT
ncbi:hypothetical protein yrohd0001_25900 [Yersinia rohdei ATCC 43380]|nr:hypothetical protein yrohd0001_25900 [Yersinia rohdei ATCC 43380]